VQRGFLRKEDKSLADAGTPKDIDRRRKAKGLTQFCSPCNQPFRDEHGFSLHCKSEAHVRQIMLGWLQETDRQWQRV
jgi:hypothetical protein